MRIFFQGEPGENFLKIKNDLISKNYFRANLFFDGIVFAF